VTDTTRMQMGDMGPHKTFILAAGLFFLFIFLTGFWVRSNGKPYSTTILTIHKLISLVAGVVLGFTIYQLIQAAGLSSVALTLVRVTSVLFVFTVLSGGIWSIEKTIPTPVLWIHQVTPILTLISISVMLYFVL